MRSVSIAILALSASLGAAPMALAQDAPIAHTAGDATADQIAQWIKADDQGAQDQGVQALTAPRQVHGEVGLSVSNRGYGGYAAVAMPVGRASELDVAVGGGHDRLPFGGSVNSRSIAVGLTLDGGDVARWLSHDKCGGMQHTGVKLREDAVTLADGSCEKPAPASPTAPSGG